MKVVINVCFGGFGVSTEAMKELISRGAIGVRKYSEIEYSGGLSRGIGNEKFVDAGDGYEVGWIKDVLYKDGSIYTFEDSENRADPVLVSVVEEMGESANGEHADLKVVEIPDGVEFTIEEYDGNEHIAEKHRTWR